MLRSVVLRAAAAAGLAFMAAPGGAQIAEIDPNTAGQYQAPAEDPYSDPAATDPAASDPYVDPYAPESGAPAEVAPEYQPIDPAQPGDTTAVPADSMATNSAQATVPREDIFTAAEGVFGRGAEGLAGVIEKILKDQGEPVAYISGQEAGGAFVVGVRYGSGTMHHQVEGDRPVYWTGPSLGFDFGADANKVFVLVYNLHDSQQLFKRYPGAEGNAYVLGGFTASYHRSGDVVLIPVRLGVGLRLGVNAGYMRFTENNRWLPF